MPAEVVPGLPFAPEFQLYTPFLFVAYNLIGIVLC